MKLTIKHISAYLPYELYFMRYEKKCLDKSVTPVIWSEDLHPFKTQLNAVSLNGFDYEKSKPILRPLSDLTKEDIISFSVIVRRVLNEDYNEEKLLSRVCYYELQWLLERHFDVFGLIPQGLAIDINTLNETK